MTMRIKAAVGAVIAAAAASSAMALPANSPIDTTVFVSGATAQDNGIEFAVRRLCVNTAAANSTMDLYRYSSNDRAWTCETNNTLVPGIGTGTGAGGNVRIQIVKFSSGGSGNGVNPLIDGTTLAFRGVDASTSCAGVARPAQGSFAQFIEHSNCTGGTTLNQVPQIGFSDVEPNKFTSQARANQLTAAGANQLVIGIPVSTNLYRALQTSQGLGSDDSYVNMPSLPSTVVAGAFNGTIVDWVQVMNKAGVSLPAPNSGDSTVKICRRNDSSGTQAITEITFLRQRCTTIATAPFLPADGAGGSGSGGTSPGTSNAANFANGNVYAGSGSPQVRDCLHAANQAGFYAIGLLSTECQPTTSSGGCGNTAAREYRFVKIDGAAPTLVDTASGRYNFYAEQSINNRPSLAGAGLAVKNRLRALLSDVNVLAQINGNFQFSFGDAGMLGVPDSGSGLIPTPPYTQTSLRAQPINSTSKNPTGSGTNNCQVAPAIQASFVVADTAAILPQGN
jgi:hypothetical protein